LAYVVVGEVVSVAKKKGIRADLGRVQATLEMAFAEHKEHKPSMLQDRLDKRKTEIDFINGAVIVEAKKIDIPVPTTETLYGLVRMLEESYLH
jgi:2-dehydropantoate 2-reductase